MGEVEEMGHVKHDIKKVGRGFPSLYLNTNIWLLLQLGRIQREKKRKEIHIKTSAV